MPNQDFTRPQSRELTRRLREPRRFIQCVSGARQVGKTTLALQVAERCKLPYHFASADEPTLRSAAGWLAAQWFEARRLAESAGKRGALLIFDEVQKVPEWSDTVKAMWDEDTRKKNNVKVVLIGSTPLLINLGLSKSLAGRFKIFHLPHWSYAEMREAFGFTLEQYIYYGAYPGSASLIKQPRRWARYIRDSLIETTISREVLLMSRVDKPALLRRLFELGCAYSGQILSYSKMLGQLQDAGNATTLAHYLELLAGVGAIAGLQKYTGGAVVRRRSTPKLQVFNTALMTAQGEVGFKEILNDSRRWGRLAESAVGAHLLNAAAGGECELFYWRHNNREVDFVVRGDDGKSLLAIEVKSGRPRKAMPGLDAFIAEHPKAQPLLVGSGGISLERFLTTPVRRWFE